MHTNAFELLIQLMFFVWVVFFFISVLRKDTKNYLSWSKNTVVKFAKKEWKVIVAIIITYLLCSANGTVNLSIY